MKRYIFETKAEPAYMTNGDRIRAMTDEELAVLLMCPYGSEPDMCYTPGNCLYCCEEWLKQEAE